MRPIIPGVNHRVESGIANPLSARFPALAAALPYVRLSSLPTPLEDAAGLAAHLGLAALAVKRDDLSAPAYGGNKIRKLEFLLGDALARNCETVVTFGSVGSNHALATSVCARQVGLSCHAVLLDQALTPYVSATLRYHLCIGTQLHPAGSFNQSRAVFERIRANHPGGAARVYEIPWGGSNWLGAAGFVAGALELAAQLGAAGEPAPDYVYVAGGTMGTAIGLALGLRVAGLGTQVVAPRAVPSGASSADRVAELVAETNRELHARDASFPLLEDPLRNLELRPEFFGSGYAEATPEAIEAVALMRDLQHVKLETTYTGKAFAGLVADARSGRLRGRRVLFWNTYSSAPYPQDLANADPAALPAAFRHYLAAATA
jgi:D-cysteine desulfhydrase